MNEEKEDYLFNDSNMEFDNTLDESNVVENDDIFLDKENELSREYLNTHDVKEEEKINGDNFLNQYRELYENQNSKSNNTRYILIGAFSAIIVLLIIIFYPKVTTVSKTNIEKQMKEYSKQYFDKYMSINDNTNEYIVTLDMLENANKQGEKYNINGLEKCKKQTTLSKIMVDSKTREVKKIEVEVNC